MNLQETLKETVNQAHKCGLSVVPPRQDGSKAPIGKTWKQYQEVRPTKEQIAEWYRNEKCTGIGFICGKVSGNLEVLDFDDKDIYEQYRSLVINSGLKDILERIESGYLEDSPGGAHCLYRCKQISGNTKLAKKNKDETLIETRGEGGYIITAPTYGKVNVNGSYVLKSGGISTIPTISPDERKALHDIARTFDQEIRIDTKYISIKSDARRPGDEYITQTRWEDILKPHGWTIVYQRGNTTYWRRPGKKLGISATTNHNDSDLLYPFTTSTVFENEKGYNRFSAYTILNHDGDFKTAAKALTAKGFGSNSNIKQIQKVSGQNLDNQTSPITEHPNKNQNIVKLVCGKDLKIQPIDWAWNGFLARGKLHIYAGAPGDGKTTVAGALGATITIGGRWPDGTRCEMGNVLMWSGEDDPSDTLLPRFLAQGGDPNRIFFVQGCSQNGEVRSFDPATDMQALVQAAEKVGDVRLVIVDPVVNAVTGDSHKNTEVRRALQPLVDMAQSMGAVVLGITHFTKGTSGRDPVERVNGSIAFGAIARIVFASAKVKSEDGKTTRLFVRAKSNIGPDGGGFEYHLEQVELPKTGIVTSKMLWGNAIEGTARELLAAADVEHTEKQETKKDRATEWLQDLLKDGPIASSEIKEQIGEAGYSWATIRRAKDDLGIKPYPSKYGGKWRWALPEVAQAEVAQKTPTQKHEQLRDKRATMAESTTYDHKTEQKIGKNNEVAHLLNKTEEGDFEQLHDQTTIEDPKQPAPKRKVVDL